MKMISSTCHITDRSSVINNNSHTCWSKSWQWIYTLTASVQPFPLLRLIRLGKTQCGQQIKPRTLHGQAEESLSLPGGQWVLSDRWLLQRLIGKLASIKLSINVIKCTNNSDAQCYKYRATHGNRREEVTGIKNKWGSGELVNAFTINPEMNQGPTV